MNIREEVLAILNGAVERLILNRIENSAFTDNVDVKKREYFSTLEGLDSIIIPAVNLKKNIFWNPLRSKYPELQNIIIDDLNFIFSMNTWQDEPPSQHGAPYFSKGPSKKKPYWTTECASFTMSVMANYLKLSESLLARPRPPRSKVSDIIRINLHWVDMCRKNNKGWSWTYNTDVHPWPTWSLLDTFEEILRFRRPNEYPLLHEQCDAVSTYITQSFDSTKRGSYYNQWRNKVLKPTQDSKSYDVETAFNLVRLILAASLHKTGHAVLSMAKCLYDWAKESDYSKCEYEYNFQASKDYIYDSSLLPYVLRALIVSAHALKPKLIDNLNGQIGMNHEIVINRVYSLLQKDLIREGIYKGLWGVKDKVSLTYELYYTERTIEALTDFLVYYEHPNQQLFKPCLKEIKLEKAKAKIPKLVHKKKVVKKIQPPSDSAEYTLLMRQLAKGQVPVQLEKCKGWKAEHLLEFYVFRLFTQIFYLDGTQWGYLKSGTNLPDGRFQLPDINADCLYDAKSSEASYNLRRNEVGKFEGYTQEGKQWGQARGKEVRYFLILAPSFSGDLTRKSNDFYGNTGVNLVCANIEDICEFADKVKEMSEISTPVRLIKWRNLLAKGKPLLQKRDFEEVFREWNKTLKRVGDY